jgi:hypothetical protein
LGETTKNVSRRFYGHKILPGIEVRGVVKVSKIVENDPFRETYWTESVEIFVDTVDGRRLFQSFHVMAVPEGRFEVLERLRKQMTGSLLSELKESISGFHENGDANGTN